MKAKRLKYGDTIGLISPSSPENRDAIDNGIKRLQSLGFKIKEGRHMYDKWGYLAGQDEDRAKDFMDMFLDKKVDMILCIRGGYGSMRVLPYLNFDTIRENPKIFMGFSDITSFLNKIALDCDLITFHGPMGSSNLDDPSTLASFINTLMEGSTPYQLTNPTDMPLECMVDGIACGKLVGGNLSLICSTLGTPFDIDTRGKILFFEDVGEEPYKIDRMLTQLLLANKLQECSGFILGQFKDCSLPHYERSLTLEEVIKDRLLSLGKPTLSNFMSGHSYPKLTVPIGAQIKIDSTNKSIEVIENVVE